MSQPPYPPSDQGPGPYPQHQGQYPQVAPRPASTVSRNWARITLTVLGGLSILISLFGLGSLSGLTLVTTVVSLLLLIGAVVLMYLKAANPWFQQPKPF